MSRSDEAHSKSDEDLAAPLIAKSTSSSSPTNKRDNIDLEAASTTNIKRYKPSKKNNMSICDTIGLSFFLRFTVLGFFWTIYWIFGLIFDPSDTAEAIEEVQPVVGANLLLEQPEMYALMRLCRGKMEIAGNLTSSWGLNCSA